jgi:hypothetical protein
MDSSATARFDQGRRSDTTKLEPRPPPAVEAFQCALKEDAMENYPWLLPAWLIGAPFVLGLVDYFTLPRAYK